MPKVKLLQSNFSTGELSPRALGRVDIARYPNAAKSMVNVISRTLGGAEKRPGTEFIRATKDSAKQSKLVPFIISRDAAYMLEMGDTYCRIFKPDGSVVGGGTPVEITTPYTEAQVQELDYSQSEDAMFLFHQDVYPNQLRMFYEASWNCSNVPFTTTPFSELGDYPAAELTLSANTVGTGRTVTAGAAVFMASDVGRAIIQNSGMAVITAYTDTTHVTVEIKAVFDAITLASGTWNLDASPQASLTPSDYTPVGTILTMTLSAAGWRTDIVGKFVRVNGGLIEITSRTSDTIAVGYIVKELTSATAAPALSWSLESTVWGGTNGYPRTGTMHEQRLVVGGTILNPQTVFGSVTGNVLDFTLGTNDDDAFSFTLSGDDSQVNQIQYLVSARNLVALTYGGEFTLQGGVEKPITPTNVQIKQQTPHGSGEVRPLQVGKETLFVQRAGRRLRAMGYKFDEDGYKCPDLTTLAEHITETGIACMALQQEPDPIVWVALNNGRLISLTLDRDLDIVAWNRHEIDGAVESIATMPAGDREQVWMIIRRDINGSIVRYVERLQPDWYPIYGTASPDADDFPPADEPFSWGFQLDCAKTQDDATGKTVWTGLDHLEGETVRVIADGVDMGEHTVASGQITLTRAAKRVLAGKFFVPLVVLLTPEVQMGTGTAQGSAMNVNEIWVRIYNTIGVTVKGQQIAPGRIIGPDQLDTAPTLQNGDVRVSMLGWSKGKSEPEISQDAPFPFHLLAAIRSITIND